MEREAGDVGLVTQIGHCAVNGLDDVAADAEIPQGWLKAGLQRPLRRTNLFRQAEPFELRGATHHQPAKLWVFADAAGSKIGNPTALVGDIAERSVETGPTFGIDLPFQSSADLQFAPRPQFQRDPLRC